MLIYKLKTFSRFARDEDIEVERFIEAVERAGRGLVDADLGGNLIKQRVARQGRGRSGGYRILIARSEDYAVLLYGFAKKDRENLGDKELQVVRELAKAWLNAKPEQIQQALRNGKLIEARR